MIGYFPNGCRLFGIVRRQDNAAEKGEVIGRETPSPLQPDNLCVLYLNGRRNKDVIKAETEEKPAITMVGYGLKMMRIFFPQGIL